MMSSVNEVVGMAKSGLRRSIKVQWMQKVERGGDSFLSELESNPVTPNIRGFDASHDGEEQSRSEANSAADEAEGNIVDLVSCFDDALVHIYA